MTTRRLSFVFVLILSLIASGVYFLFFRPDITGAPPYGLGESEVPVETDPYAWLRDWKRPEGPAKVALQVGHWKNDDFPEELAKLRTNDGASGGGKAEWEVNYAIASSAAELLRAEGVEVEILPATVPPRYWADAFIAIHADGNPDRSVSGYKVAPPWRDWTENADELTAAIDASYSATTRLPFDPNITRNMRGYYAFAFWRYEHAVHPMTTSVIVETGFLTNPADRRVIVDQPEVSAKGIANGVLAYLRERGLVEEEGQ